MEIVCVISGIVSLVCIIFLILYRKQIRSLNTQIKYINEHETNMMLTRELGLKEINELVESLNKYMEINSKKQLEVRKKDEQLKEVITNISHDIRTPLTSLNGYFELLDNTQDIEERRKYASIIRERINCLKEMLEQLFTYVKLQNGEYKFEFEKLDIREELIGTLLEFREEFNNADIEPVINLPEISVNVSINRMAFARIMQNIIKNAIVHGEKYFEVSMEIINKDESRYVDITVKNDVKNIEDIDISKVFDRFYKVDKSRSQISTGLGLAIAKDMTEKLSGKIEAIVENGFFEISCIFVVV